MSRDIEWKRVLSDTLDWNGKVWVQSIIERVLQNSSPEIDFLLTLGPGMAGTEAWIFRDYYPNLNIIGLEPQTERYEFLKDKFPGELLNQAATSYEGTTEGWMGHKNGKSDFWLTADEENSRHYIKKEVKCTTVDNILRDVKGVGFLWMDIEGAEFEALRGSLISLLTSKIMFLNVEIDFSDNKDKTYFEPSYLIHLLHSLGFIAIGSPCCEIKVLPNGIQYACALEVDNHTDILFANIGTQAGVPLHYLTIIPGGTSDKSRAVNADEISLVGPEHASDISKS